ncbi:MAG TPA: hypothetical protein VHG35_09145 [Gemmatimonadales bacterium]|nr:hypothetical protein [Gemmatimonadales bacterium]
MRRRRRSSRLGLFFALVLSGALLGASVWLDRRGDEVLAPVAAKHERVTLRHDPQGTWYRWYELGVAVGNSGAGPWVATIEVPEDRYDSVALGDSIEVRYLPQLPLYARASSRSTATVLHEAAGRTGIVPLLLWLAGGAAGLWVAARIGTPVIFAAGTAWMVAGVPVLLRAPAPRIPTASEGTARVSVVTVVAKSPERARSRRRSRSSRSGSLRRLALPYQVVQLRLPVPGRGDSVLVVDAVDSGSVAGLAVGAELPVRYEPDAPRDARLAQGTRQFIERNRYHFLPVAIGVPALGTLAAWGVRSRRRRSRATSGAGSAARSNVPA